MIGFRATAYMGCRDSHESIIYGNPHPPNGSKRETKYGIVTLLHRTNADGTVRLVEKILPADAHPESDDLSVSDIQDEEFGWYYSGDMTRNVAGPKFVEWGDDEIASLKGLRFYLG
jgi:hypothetical protein